MQQFVNIFFYIWDLQECWQDWSKWNVAQNIQIIFHNFWDLFGIVLILGQFSLNFYKINSNFLLHNWKVLSYNILLLFHNNIWFLENFAKFSRQFSSCFNFQDFQLNHHMIMLLSKMNWFSANFFVLKSILGVQLKLNWVYFFQVKILRYH